MSWKIAAIHELADVKTFLIKQEWQAVTVSEHYRLKLGGLLYPLKKQSEIFINKIDGTITDLLLFTRYGLIYPVFTTVDPVLNNLDAVMQLSNRRVHSIMGLSHHVETLLSALNLAYRYQVNYEFLGLNKTDFLGKPENQPGCFVKRAKPRDRHKLFPLQRAYELEEVYLEPQNFQAHACLRQLKNKLGHQRIYFLDKGGPIAKAGTNAQGFKIDQIGGVFTRKDFRNKGYSTYLLKHLFTQLFKTKDKIVLFVKPENLSAKRVYSKLNFHFIDKFQINYF